MQKRFYHPEKSVIRHATIGDGCTVHALVWIGDVVIIGQNCKIQAFAFIPDGVIIEDNVFIGPHVCFTNDKKPPSNGEHWAKTTVKSGAVIGAGAIILPGVTIGENAMIGAGAVVTKDVKPGTTVVGNPAKELKPKPEWRHHEDP